MCLVEYSILSFLVVLVVVVAVVVVAVVVVVEPLSGHMWRQIVQ